MTFELPVGATGETGATGANGSSCSLNLGNIVVNTLSAGSNVTLSIINSGTSLDNVWNMTFGLPVGQTGLNGDTGEKVDTGASGLKGDTGEKGDTGASGLKGDTGEKEILVHHQQ